MKEAVAAAGQLTSAATAVTAAAGVPPPAAWLQQQLGWSAMLFVALLPLLLLLSRGMSTSLGPSQ